MGKMYCPKGRNKIMYDTNAYSKDNLNSKDKAVVDELTRIKGELLSRDNIEEYLNQTFKGAGIACMLVREQLSGFVDFMKTQWDYCICDKIIESIESYEEQTETESEEMKK